MATSNIIRQSTIIRRAEPMVEKVFRNITLYRAEKSAAAALSMTPQLVFLAPWLGAKEKIAHKFVAAWRRRGFNVLHLESSVWGAFLPGILIEDSAKRVAEYLNANQHYKVIIHALSVGGYTSQRLLLYLKDTETSNMITHQIFDSYTNCLGLHAGVNAALNPKYRSIVDLLLPLYMKTGSVQIIEDTTAQYEKSIPVERPALFMHSLADSVSSYNSFHKTVQSYARNKPVYEFIMPKEDKVDHVGLFHRMGEESYMSCITRFLRNHNFSPLRPHILQEEDVNSETARINMERTERVVPKTS